MSARARWVFYFCVALAVVVPGVLAALVSVYFAWLYAPVMIFALALS